MVSRAFCADLLSFTGRVSALLGAIEAALLDISYRPVVVLSDLHFGLIPLVRWAFR